MFPIVSNALDAAATLASTPAAAVKTLSKKTPVLSTSLSEFSTAFVFDNHPRVIKSLPKRATAATGTQKACAPIAASSPANPHPAARLGPSKRGNMSATSLDKHDISTDSFPAKIIVHDGDLKLSVGLTVFQRKVFLVASQALWAVSPVFKAMLGPTSSFKEAVTLRNLGSEPPVVDLDDDFDAMEIVLNVLFHQHPRLPAIDTYTCSQIFQIALITEKYELHNVMHYWSRDLHKRFEAISETAINDDSVFISWVFGYDEIFSEKTGRLTLLTAPHPEHRISFRKLGPNAKVRHNAFIRPSTPEAVIGETTFPHPLPAPTANPAA